MRELYHGKSSKAETNVEAGSTDACRYRGYYFLVIIMQQGLEGGNSVFVLFFVFVFGRATGMLPNYGSIQQTHSPVCLRSGRRVLVLGVVMETVFIQC